MKNRYVVFNVIAVLAAAGFTYFANESLGAFEVRILNLCLINAILGMSMNLINGFTGLFSLGHIGFMAVGAYTTALLTLPPATKQAMFVLAPLVAPLDTMHLPFFWALLLSGVLAAVAGILIGYPVLRLKGDYLAVATLGFSEIIRIVLTNAQSVTNGALGLKSIPTPAGIVWWCFGATLVTLIALVSLIRSSYGRALLAIREDEIAAEAMGVNLAKNKVMSFAVGSFFAGIAGGLMASLYTTIDPKQFIFINTFNILLIIVLGGMGSLSGSIMAAFIVTIAMEALRFLDTAFLGFANVPAMPGLRMVVFSILLMAVVLFWQHGIMGKKELTWDMIFAIGRKKRLLAKGGEDQ